MHNKRTMRRPKLGPKEKAGRQKDSKRSWIQRRRAEERFETRGRDSDASEAEDDTNSFANLETPEVVQEEIGDVIATPQHSRPKRVRIAGPRNLEEEISNAELMQDMLEDPYNTMSDKDDSEFGTDGSLSDNAHDSDAELVPETRQATSSEESSSQVTSDESDIVSSSEDTDDIDDTLENPLLYPPSQPIPYDCALEDVDDPKLEFFRAVTSVKVRHDVSDAAIDDLIKVRFQ